MDGTIKEDGRGDPDTQYATLKDIARRLKETDHAAFGGDVGLAVEQVTEAVKDTESYLTVTLIGGIHARLDVPYGPDQSAAWKKAQAAIRKLNRLCLILGLPDYLPEDPAKALEILVVRRKKVFGAHRNEQPQRSAGPGSEEQPKEPAAKDAPSFVIENGVLKRYAGPGGEVTVPAGVTAIGGRAFAGCTALAGITIPAGVTAIGDGAFAGCTALPSIALPASLSRIGKWAFLECTSLARVTLPASLEDIAPDAFEGCDKLEEFIETAGA